MAGNGPAPKDRDKRQRRNATPPSTAMSAPKAEAPTLDREKWSDETLAWWDTWVDSPQATQFTATDWQRLTMLLHLVEDFFTDPDRQLLGEIRLNEAKLGATPEDRQRLRWEISAEDPDAKPSTRKSSRKKKDPRAAHLKAVN